MVSENGQLQQPQQIIRISQDGHGVLHQSPQQMVMLVQGDSVSPAPSPVEHVSTHTVKRGGVTYATVRVRITLCIFVLSIALDLKMYGFSGNMILSIPVSWWIAWPGWSQSPWWSR